MARPRKNNADYFTHDAGMRDDDKIKAVRRKFKHEGYSIWCMLLEKMCHTEYFKIPYSDDEFELMAGDFDIEMDRLKEILEYFTKLKLTIVSEGFLYSKRMISQFSPLIEKRKRERNELSTAITTESEVIGDDKGYSKVKESIVKHSTGEQSTGNESKGATRKEEDDLPF